MFLFGANAVTTEDHHVKTARVIVELAPFNGAPNTDENNSFRFASPLTVCTCHWRFLESF
jgi:hypothetical protein